MTERALYRVSFDVCQRSRGGDAVKLAAYNACTRLTHHGVTYDFRRKAREHVGRTLLLAPAGFPSDTYRNPGQLWRAAEAAERRGDAQTARQILVTIPREVPAARRVDFLKHVLLPLREAGMAMQLDIHDPGARDGAEQPHAHVLAVMREFDGQGFARTKARGREWNRAFTENRGREMRARIADRMNHWFELAGLDCRVDHRSNVDRDGDDSIPPEPQVSRDAIEIERRRPGSSRRVVELDMHRERRRRVQQLDAEIAAAEAQSAALTRRVSQRQLQPGRRPMTTEAQTETPWVRETGRLSPAQLTAARASYDRWRETQLRRGRDESKIYDFERYVSYVRDQNREQPGRQNVRPGDNRDAAFARQTRRDREPGFSRRHRFLADLLAEHYAVDELDPSVAQGIRRVVLDRQARTATVYLRDGSHFIDHGDRIEYCGAISQPSATEIAAAAGRHGWTSVALTGSDDFKDGVAVALSLREPPIAHDHTLSPAAPARLATALAARQPAGVTPTMTTETSHADSIRPTAGRAGAGSAAAAADDGPAARAVRGAVLDAPAGDDGRAPARRAGLPDVPAAGGLGDATDDEILGPLLRFYEPRISGAEALLAARPKAAAGTSRLARLAQQRQADFDESDVARRARVTLATVEALHDPVSRADLLDAVRRTGSPLAAEDEMQRQQAARELARRQQTETPEPDAPRHRPA